MNYLIKNEGILKLGDIIRYRPDLAGHWNDVYKFVEYNKYDLIFEVVRKHWNYGHELFYDLNCLDSNFITLVSADRIGKLYIYNDEYIKLKTIEKLDKLLGSEE